MTQRQLSTLLKQYGLPRDWYRPGMTALAAKVLANEHKREQQKHRRRPDGTRDRPLPGQGA